MKRGDVWLLAIIIAAGSVFLYDWLDAREESKAYTGTLYAQITIDGKLYETVELTEEEHRIELRTELGYNLLLIKDHSIQMIDADCPDDLCILMGVKRSLGEKIVCLPNRVLVEIIGDEGSTGGDSIDAVAT